MNASNFSRSGGLVGAFTGLLRLVLAGFLGLLAFLFMIGLGLFGLTLGLAVLLWARLTGRGPSMTWVTRFSPNGFRSPFAKRSRARATAEGEVVDAVVREVPTERSPGSDDDRHSEVTPKM